MTKNCIGLLDKIKTNYKYSELIDYNLNLDGLSVNIDINDIGNYIESVTLLTMYNGIKLCPISNIEKIELLEESINITKITLDICGNQNISKVKLTPWINEDSLTSEELTKYYNLILDYYHYMFENIGESYYELGLYRFDDKYTNYILNLLVNSERKNSYYVFERGLSENMICEFIEGMIEKGFGENVAFEFNGDVISNIVLKKLVEYYKKHGFKKGNDLHLYKWNLDIEGLKYLKEYLEKLDENLVVLKYCGVTISDYIKVIEESIKINSINIDDYSDKYKNLIRLIYPNGRNNLIIFNEAILKDLFIFLNVDFGYYNEGFEQLGKAIGEKGLEEGFRLVLSSIFLNDKNVKYILDGISKKGFKKGNIIDFSYCKLGDEFANIFSLLIDDIGLQEDMEIYIFYNEISPDGLLKIISSVLKNGIKEGLYLDLFSVLDCSSILENIINIINENNLDLSGKRIKLNLNMDKQMKESFNKLMNEKFGENSIRLIVN